MEKALFWEGEPVITYALELPPVPEEGRYQPVAAYYQKLGEAWKTRWEGELFQKAILALLAARERSKPFEPWDMKLSATVTYHKNKLWSLYIDASERTDDARPYVFRQGDTWNLESGAPCLIESFFDQETKWRKEIIREITRQIQERIQSGESLLDRDAVGRAEKEIDFRRFYRTEEGIIIFYPLDILGPFAEGIPVFLVKKACAEEDIGI